MVSADVLSSSIALVIVAGAAAIDLATRRIPNALTFGAMLLGLTLHLALGVAEGGALGALRGGLTALLAVALCGAMPLYSYARGEMGGGDVKLFVALGVLCGPARGFDVQAYTYLVTLGFVLPARLAWHGRLGQAAGNAWGGVRNLFRRREERVALPVLALPPVVMAPSILAGFVIAHAAGGLAR